VPDGIRPPRLRPGSTIGVAAVSGPVDDARLRSGVRSLEERGYRVRLAPNIGARRGFLAGSDEERADGYRALLADPAVDAVFFARGGYGASRIIDRVDPAELVARPRIHLGGSDLTALFALFAVRTGLVCFYGPMVAVSMADPASRLDWENVLSGGVPPPYRFSPDDVLSPGTGEGPLRGGCLSLLASLAGTTEAVSGRDAVFFWEDVGEEAYKLDRMLTQLERSGTFEGIQAMVIGSISPGASGGEETPEVVGAWLRGRFAGAPFPVVRGLPAGHVRDCRTLPFGTTVRLDTDRGVLEFSESGVA
jgi:muramoyltetrapeptide carboxypeptidase